MEPSELDLPELPQPELQGQPEQPKIVEEEKEEEEIEILKDVLIQLKFYSDQVKFNGYLYQKINLIEEKLTLLDDKITKEIEKDGKN